MSTLIVRDALLACLGQSDASCEDPEGRLRERVAAVAVFTADVVRDCCESLVPDALSPEADPDVLSALTLLALAHPEAARTHGVEASAYGRVLAERLESLGRLNEAGAVLRVMADALPHDAALENDLTAFLARAGRTSELADRYERYAEVLLERGEHEQAIAWLKEALLLDRSRTDVARLIRDLRFTEVQRDRARGSRWRFSAIALVASLIVSTALLHEVRVTAQWKDLPRGSQQDLTAMRARLAGVERFIDEHPVWHGSLLALEERAELRVEVDRREEALELANERRAKLDVQRRAEAESARRRGRMVAEQGDLLRARAEFRRALELAEPDWPHRQRVQRDVDAITAYLAEVAE